MVTDLLHHPEHNTSLILRAEILSDVSYSDADHDSPLSPLSSHFSPPHIPNYVPNRILTRRLLPRSLKRDAPMTQFCTFYHQEISTGTSAPDQDSHARSVSTLIILTPELDAESPKVPFYHPPVSHLAFHYIAPDPVSSISPPLPTLQIEIIPLSNRDTGEKRELDDYANPNSRLYRTCLALLETVFRHGWGFLTGYKKRVVHDVRRKSFFVL